VKTKSGQDAEDGNLSQMMVIDDNSDTPADDDDVQTDQFTHTDDYTPRDDPQPLPFPSDPVPEVTLVEMGINNSAAQTGR
jgi:hypothetical protein